MGRAWWRSWAKTWRDRTPVPVRKGMIEFEDAEIGPDAFCFEGVIFDPWNRRERLVEGEKYRVFINPFAPDRLFVCDAALSYLGESKRIVDPSRANKEAGLRMVGHVSHEAVERSAGVPRARRRRNASGSISRSKPAHHSPKTSTPRRGRRGAPGAWPTTFSPNRRTRFPQPNPAMTAIPSTIHSMSEEPPTPKDAAKGKPFDALLHAQAVEHRTSNGYSLKDLGRQFECSDATISRYLSKKPEGDVEKLEAIISRVLNSASRRAEALSRFFESTVSRKVRGVLRDDHRDERFRLDPRRGRRRQDRVRWRLVCGTPEQPVDDFHALACPAAASAGRRGRDREPGLQRAG